MNTRLLRVKIQASIILRHEPEGPCVNAHLRLMDTMSLRQEVMIRLWKESSMSVILGVCVCVLQLYM